MKGLPPQVRGARVSGCTGASISGLTPAGAGSTNLPPETVSVTWAYPRRCGEHSLLVAWLGKEAGLPPQVRGAQIDGCQQTGPLGLTPAGAGSTASNPESTDGFVGSAFGAGWLLGWCVCAGWRVLGRAGLECGAGAVGGGWGWAALRGALSGGSDEQGQVGDSLQGGGEGVCPWPVESGQSVAA